MAESIWIAIAMVMVIEGLGPMLFPQKWRETMLQLAQQPANHLRTFGGVLVTIGIVSLFYLL